MDIDAANSAHLRDPRDQISYTKKEWACPCNGCAKAVAQERKELIRLVDEYKKEYLEYRGSSFDKEGNLLWAKDDALSFTEGLDYVSSLIKDRMPKPKK